MKIEYFQNPIEEDVDFLTKKIDEENIEFPPSRPFAFFIKDTHEKIVAGANGFILYGSIYTDQLWVDKKYRGLGYAKKIMDKIHTLGNAHKCTMAIVKTMSFQSVQGFYETLGYKEEFVSYGYMKESSCIFMRKKL